jgi:hypothetical protein
MVRHNAAEALGPLHARGVDPFAADLRELDEQARPVATDNKLHAWEWLRTPEGRFVKTDALDHHAGHDLVGCQDIAWDLAGAWVELRLDEAEIGSLVERVSCSADRTFSRRRLQFYRVAYLAFQLGRATFGVKGIADGLELQRMQRSMNEYRELLEGAIEGM